MKLNFDTVRRNIHYIVGGYVTASFLLTFLLPQFGIAGNFFALLAWSSLFVLAFGFLAVMSAILITMKRHMSAEDQLRKDAISERLSSIECSLQTLSKFLHDFDERSRKYFHATSQKTVHTYFALRNIEAALSGFLGEVAPIRDGRARPGSELFEETDRILSAELIVANSLGKGDNSQTVIAFGSLDQKISELRERLNDSVRDIEREIRSLPKSAN